MKDKKQKIKRALIVGLCAVILSVTVISTYQEAKEVKAFAPAIPIAFIVAVLGAYGIYLTYDWLNDGNNALDISNALEEEYNAERFKLIQGGGSDPDDEPPEWDDLSVMSLESKKLLLTNDIALCTFAAVSSLWDKLEKFGSKVADSVIPDVKPDVDISLPLDGLQGMNGLNLGNVTVSRGYWLPPNSEYSAFLKRFDDSRGLGLYYMTVYDPSLPSTSPGLYKGFFGGNYDSQHRTWIHSTESYVTFANYYLDSSGVWRDSGSVYWYTGDSYSDGNSSKVSLSPKTGGRVVIDPNSEILVGGDTIGKAVPYKKPVVWTTPELQDDIDTNGGLTPLEIPDNKQYPVELPSLDRLREIDTSLDPSPNPDTGIVPAPDYDPLRDLISDLKPNPNPDPAPEPSPDPEPVPDPDPAPDPDEGGNENDGSSGLPDLTFDIKEIFPFCIPFDLIMAFKLFEAPAEAPVWKLPLKIPSLGIDYVLTIDFNDFESLAVVLRWIELVSFIIGLILITRSHLIHS